MNPLQAELHRLYLPEHPPADAQHPAGNEAGLIDANGHVRAMVLAVAQLAGCSCVLALWQGVQDELGLPAAAMAVSGSGYQVWFSLREPVPAAQAMVFLESLRLRYLAEVAERHVVMWPVSEASGQIQHAQGVPAQQADTGHWSAFVAPGLISMFADEPWLDLPPSADAQAKLLANFESMSPAGFRQALARLRPSGAAAAPDTALAAVDMTGGANAPRDAAYTFTGESTDPHRFLLAVMNDPAVEMHLRIEAAKALLPYGDGSDRR